ncbi:MAG TPA: hypothetical protein VK837_02575 [Longimicrobiales bacterium]|nr:hypothetical protein [Longimicrobiales bacterium]
MSNMALYLMGVVLVILAGGYGALQLGVPPLWIGIAAVIILGFAMMSGVSSTRKKEESPVDEA